ncbi:MAG: response regulator transcription factor [Cyanobacteria bacterium P01_G01_bin.39]
MIKVLIVDDQNLTHKLIETHLKSETNIKIVGFAEDGQEALAKIPDLQPDVILMDLEMPKMDGLKATRIISQKFPGAKVLILTVHDNEQHLSTALKNGAKGYLLKTTTAQELKTAIYYANQGYFQLSVELTEKYLQKIIITQSEVEEISEIKRQLKYLDKALHQIEDSLISSQDSNTGKELEQRIESMLKREMSRQGDRDSHLQFKVDRMKYNQERLEKNIKYLFKLQIGCIVIILLSIISQVFSVFN